MTPYQSTAASGVCLRHNQNEGNRMTDIHYTRRRAVLELYACALLAAMSLAPPGVVKASAADVPQVFPDANATDPVKLGWMVGSPPPPDKSIRYDDGSSYRFPQWRWSFSHWRELMPSVEIARGKAR